MKSIHFKRVGAGIGAVAILSLIFVVSSAAQTDIKYTDAATYYKDAKASCVMAKGLSVIHSN